MPFPYRYICDLLQQLDDELRKSPERQTSCGAIVREWFRQHRSLLDAPGNDACAIISMLLPERRTDRVYNIQAPKLQSIFGKALMLGASRVLELRRWAEPGSGIDLADCVESALRRTPNSRDDTTDLTVEEIDETLGRIAAACRFSSPTVRSMHQTAGARDPNTLLAGIYIRLGSRDAKWFTRLVLKNYQPVVLSAHTVFHNYHPLLPQIMKIKDDFSSAITCLQQMDAKSDTPSAIAGLLKPSLGTKVGRQPWFKGRSIKNCMDMARGRDMICEQKIDGEYCQIHVDLRKPRDCIQIFSKSGKDSTADRILLHKAIRASLKIGNEACPISKNCILEGELVVYSTKEHKILPFHKIRKHVSRSGSFLGTAHDSQPHDYERIMIMYYDVLFIDDESLLGLKNSERFRRLNEIITCQEGFAQLVPRTTIRTSRPSAALALRELFAQCISSRGEGLVLKPDEPYFDFDPTDLRFSCCNIKVKKEYFQGLGDVGDFAVIGASYDAAKAREYRLPKVKWTHFYIGCLENSHQVRAKTEMPKFRVTNIVELTGPILTAFWAHQRPISVPYEENTSIEISYSGSLLAKKPTVIFPCPLVFDMRCFAFDKEPNTNFWSMRFPQVSKVHHDRSYLDTITFAELQKLAEAATNVPEEEDSQEMRQWVKELEKRDGGKFRIDDPSQATTCSNDVPSSPSSSASHLSPSQSRGNLPTPPRFSASEAITALAGTEPTNPTASASSCHKRSATEQSGPRQSAKRYRRHSGVSSIGSPHESAPKNHSATRTGPREPLSQVNPNGENNRTESQRALPALPMSTSSVKDKTGSPVETAVASSPTAAYYTASEMVSSSPYRGTITQPGSATSGSSKQANTPNASCCTIATHECILASCSILLSPCISSYAWVTDDLLTRHGISDPLLDPRVWNNADVGAVADAQTSTSEGTGGGSELEPTVTSTSPDTDTDTDTGVRKRRQRRLRKICLVESKRKEATRAFLRKIEDARLKTKSGQREWVTVYDWRVLEFITEQEGRTASSRARDPWRQFYLGII
ncbi:hypothetical protein F5Y14DRAFT_203242 [Nemania sp. NC0429]|nr:hypothetical protein F5Y14DRAFT_203242 [Nemania sp. NC0429]